MRIAVIGLGQSLRGDDAVGLEAVRQWQEKFPETASRPEIRIETSELPGLALLDLLDGCEAAILIDALQSSASPGTIRCLSPEKLSAFETDSKSAHGWGVTETLRLGQKLNPSLKKLHIQLIGVEADQFQMGAGLSQQIQQALPQACEAIQTAVESFL